MFGLAWSQILALSVIAAVITTIGNLFGTVLKEHFLARSLEKWRAQRAAADVYRRYSCPILLAAIELAGRLQEILREYPPSYLRSDLIGRPLVARQHDSARDEHFDQYKLISSIYRLCAFLGWLELYRQEIVFLDSGQSKRNSLLEKCIGRIRSVLADGQLNKAHDWHRYKDVLLYREEQRAIGEVLIMRVDGERAILGYADFALRLTNGDEPRPVYNWVTVAAEFITDLGDETDDFRFRRFAHLLDHLIDLIVLLEPSRANDERIQDWQRLAKSLASPLQNSRPVP